MVAKEETTKEESILSLPVVPVVENLAIVVLLEDPTWLAALLLWIFLIMSLKALISLLRTPYAEILFLVELSFFSILSNAGILSASTKEVMISELFIPDPTFNLVNISGVLAI